MSRPLAFLSDEELELLAGAFDADGDEARRELELRAREELADFCQDDGRDEPTDWHADRACDAWERGRDAIAERAR